MKKLTVTQKEFLLGELIGKRVRVLESSHRGYVNLEGTVADETARTLVLHTGKGTKIVPKDCCKFAFPDAPLEVEGSLLVSRPEDRTKKLLSRL